MPSTCALPASALSKPYKIRSAVDLPAPLRPSRPVMAPSRAWNDPPSTALTLPNCLTRLLTLIIHCGTPAPGGEEWSGAELIEAAGVQSLDGGGLHDLGDQPGRTAIGKHAMPDPFGDQMPGVAQCGGNLLAPARWRYRILACRENQHRFGGDHRLE